MLNLYCIVWWPMWPTNKQDGLHCLQYYNFLLVALQPYFLVHTVTHIIHPTKSLIHINMVQQANNHWIKPRSHKHFQYFKSSSTWSLVQTSLHIHIFSTSNHQTNGHWFKLHFSYTSSILQIFTNFTYIISSDWLHTHWVSTSSYKHKIYAQSQRSWFNFKHC